MKCKLLDGLNVKNVDEAEVNMTAGSESVMFSGGEFDIIKAELEEKQFKVKLTVIDTPGFGDYVNNRDSWLPIVEFIDDQHEAYMRQEQQPERNEKTDLRVHACLYFIRPTGHT